MGFFWQITEEDDENVQILDLLGFAAGKNITPLQLPEDCMQIAYIVCKKIFIQNLKIVFRPLPIVIVYSMFHVCDQSDSRTGTSFTNDVR